MNRQLLILIFMGSFLFVSTLALGNPATLPQHPGYPMGEAKAPISGQSVANDPGQSPPSQEESLRQAGEFHDAQALNPGKEKRPNIVQPGAAKSMEAQGSSTNQMMDSDRESVK